MPSLHQQPTSKMMSPQASLSNYVNQQLGGLVSGTSPITGSADRNAGAGFAERGSMESLSPVAQIHKTGLEKLKASGQRIALYQQMGAQRRTRAATAGRQFGSSGGGGVGQAWQPNGKLSASRNRALSLASSYLGSRYILGGTSKNGIDCSGLVMMVYNQLGYKINMHSAGWQGRNIPGVRTQNINKLRPGDIVAWKDGSHIAIYAGNGQIIEAANPRVGTVRRRIWANPSQIYGIMLRLPGE